MSTGIKKMRQSSVRDMVYGALLKWRGLLIGALVIAEIFILYSIAHIILSGVVYGTKSIVVEVTKFAVFGLIVGLLISFIVKVLIFISSDSIKTMRDITNNTTFNIIGKIPQSNCSSKGLDKIVKRIGGVEIKAEDRENLIKCSAAEFALIAKQAYKKSTCPLAIVSSSGRECVEEYINLIKVYLHDDVLYTVCGDIRNDADSITDIAESQSVILVEKLGISKYSYIEETCIKLDGWNKKVAGLVVLGADAQ